MLQLPKHECQLSIVHNEHKSNYETVEQWLEDDFFQWDSEEAKQRAIETDEVWTIQWYPNTPIGSHAIAAPTLEEALELANR